MYNTYAWHKHLILKQKKTTLHSMSAVTYFPTIYGKTLQKKDLSLSVSRVLSCTVIYLGLPSPISSSDVHGIPSDGQPY